MTSTSMVSEAPSTPRQFQAYFRALEDEATDEATLLALEDLRFVTSVMRATGVDVDHASLTLTDHDPEKPEADEGTTEHREGVTLCFSVVHGNLRFSWGCDRLDSRKTFAPSGHGLAFVRLEMAEHALGTGRIEQLWNPGTDPWRRHTPHGKLPPILHVIGSIYPDEDLTRATALDGLQGLAARFLRG